MIQMRPLVDLAGFAVDDDPCAAHRDEPARLVVAHALRSD